MSRNIRNAGELASNAELRSRDELARTLREMEQIPGVTAIIYDQECAAEKRRKRSRGILAEPTLRLVINEEVCEGCGDCVTQSNCMSLTPVMTELGQKIRIHQSSCNKDYTCALGDCPSFVSVQIKPGTGLKKKALPELPATEVPAPRKSARPGEGYRIIAPGIGGTGVVTINALLATAAWIDGLHVATLDQTGTSQKGGAVVSHLLLSEQPIEAPAKVNTGNADLILGFDLLGVVHADNLKTRLRRTNRRGCQYRSGSDHRYHPRANAAGRRRARCWIWSTPSPIAAATSSWTPIAWRKALFGSHMAVNMFPDRRRVSGRLDPHFARSDGAGHRAERRRYGAQPAGLHLGPEILRRCGRRGEAGSMPEAPSKSAFDRVAELRRISGRLVTRNRTSISWQAFPTPRCAKLSAIYLYKLMAYKDEYEVARLLTKPEFENRARGMWESVGVDLLQPASATAAALGRAEKDSSLVLGSVGHCWY